MKIDPTQLIENQHNRNYQRSHHKRNEQNSTEQISNFFGTSLHHHDTIQPHSCEHGYNQNIT